MKKIILSVLTIVVLCLSVNAATVAYWRLEEGTNGVHDADMDNYYRDSSGNGNHMQQPAQGHSRSIATNDVPVAVIPQTLATNIRARAFDVNVQNVGTFGYESSTAKPVESNPFDNGFTVECMARSDGGGWQVAVGKDGFDAFAHNTWVDPNFAIKFRYDSDTPQHIQMHFWDDNTKKWRGIFLAPFFYIEFFPRYCYNSSLIL